MCDLEIAWNKYSKYIDLYPKYLEIVLKYNAFFIGITGALISYILGNDFSNKVITHVLLLPIVVGLMLCFFCCFGAHTYRGVLDDMNSLETTLGLEKGIRTDGLIWVYKGSFFVNLLIVLGIFALYCNTLMHSA